MYCIHCGKELPEDARFCSRCGKPQPINTAPPEPPEPSDIPEIPNKPPKPQPDPVPELGQEFYDALAAAFEQIDTPKPEQPPEPTISVPPATEALSTVIPPEPPAEWKPPVSLRNPPPRKAIFLLIGIILLVIALAAVLVRLVTPQPIGEDAFVYITSDNHNLMFRKDLKPGTTPKELSDISGGNVTFSEDGKHLYFNNSGNLYCSDLNKAGEWNATEKVSSNITAREVMKNGGAVYITESGEGFRMYYYDGWDSIQLADNTNNGFYFADKTENMVYYTSETEDGSYAYYRVPVDGSAEPEKLIDDFDDILYVDNDAIVYSKRGDYGLSKWYGSFYIAGKVYRQTPGGETTILAEDVGSVLSVTGKKGKITMIYATTCDQESGRFDLCKSEDGVVTVLVSDTSITPSYSVENDIYLYAREGLGGTITYYQKINGVESELPLEENTVTFGNYILSSSEVAIGLNTPDGKILQAYKVSKNQLTPSTLICDGDFSSISFGIYKDKTVLYYYVDVDPESYEGTLMRYMDGKSTVVAKNVGNVRILSDESAVFTIDEDGVLYEVNADGKREPVTSEATEFAILSDKKIVYISNENLYVWNNGKTEKLVGGVERIFVPHEAEYRSCYCY